MLSQVRATAYSPNINGVSILENGLIYKTFNGDQNGQSIRKLQKETEKCVLVLRKQNKKVLILADLSNLGRTTLSARKAEIDFINKLDFDKAAVFGDGIVNRTLAKLIVNASAKAFKINFFSTRDEAESWLLEANN